MKMSDLDEKAVEIVRVTAVRSLHERGVQRPTPRQIDTECESVLRSIDRAMSEDTPTVDASAATLVIDHTAGILKQARGFRREQNWQLACVFYALWVEHKINQWLGGLARKKLMPSDEIDAMLRETQHRAKLSWLLRLLGAPSVNEKHRNKIKQLMDRRNAFVHYKWKPHRPKDIKELSEFLTGFETTVKYLRRFEERAFGILSDKKAKRILSRVIG